MSEKNKPVKANKSRTSKGNCFKQKQKKFQCTGCNQIFSSKAQLLRHVKFSSDSKCSNTDDIHKCNICGKEFLTEKTLHYHIRSTTICNALTNPDFLGAMDIPSTTRKDKTYNMLSKYVVDNSSIQRSKTSDIEVVQEVYAGRDPVNVKRSRLCSSPKTKSNSNNKNYSKEDCSSYTNDISSCIQSLKKHAQYQYTPSTEITMDISEFFTFCEQDYIRMSLNLSGIIQNHSSHTCKKDNEIIAILTHHGVLGDSSVLWKMRTLRMTINNNISILYLDDTFESLPVRSIGKISSTDIDMFLCRHATIHFNRKVYFDSMPSTSTAAGGNSTVKPTTTNQHTLSDFISANEVVVSDSNGDCSRSTTANRSSSRDAMTTIQPIIPIDFDEDPEIVELDGEDEMDIAIFDENDHHNNQEQEVIDIVMKEYQNHINNARRSSMYNCNDIANIELYEILRKAGSPTYLFDEIQDWGMKHSSTLAGQHRGARLQRRQTFVQNMAKKVYGPQFSLAMKPNITNLVLPSGNSIELITSSFKAQVTSLLTDYELMQTGNLLLNSENPFLPNRNAQKFADLDSGWWYKETRELLCRNPSRHILLPLVFFIDSSNVDKSGRLAVEPVTFTLGIFKRHIRNLAESWRTIGYLENTHMSSDGDITANQSVASKAQDYHAMLDLILTELREVQGPLNGFEWTLDLNGKKYDVIFKIATQVIIGDCKGNDLLCGRYGSHSMKVKHLCRDCNVLTENGDDPNHICKMWTRQDICNKSKEEMNDISFHHINNTFDDIHFGARDLCITQVTPPEPLHGFKLGLCKYLFEGFEKQVAPKTMRLVNQTSRNMARRLKLPCAENLPALNPFRRKVSFQAVNINDGKIYSFDETLDPKLFFLSA